MADQALIAELVASGMDLDEARRAADGVLGAIKSLLVKGKTVGIPEVGRLVAPRKAVWVPGSKKTRAFEQRKVGLRHAGVIEKGDPYQVHPAKSVVYV